MLSAVLQNYKEIFDWEIEKWANLENPNMGYRSVKPTDEKEVLLQSIG